MRRAARSSFHECLLRIRRADGTLIPALDIVPVAERLGLVRLLDQRVLELAIEEMVAHPDLQASLNVSASSTMDPDWWSRLEALLHLHEHVAERLIVEITETAAIHDIDNARGFVARVKDLGARIAIDDFGAGYTSFRNLRKLGVDMIKIDGAFVEKLMRSEDDRTFVRTHDRSRTRAEAEDRRRMGAGRADRRHPRGLGLRLSAGRAYRAGGAGAAGFGRNTLRSFPRKRESSLTNFVD